MLDPAHVHLSEPPDSRARPRPRNATRWVFALGLLAISFGSGWAAEEERPAKWAEFVEPDFPFFSSVLDARQPGSRGPTNNLTPRGLILNLGHDCWACFDVDLLRMAVIWEGAGVTPVGLAQGSYHRPGHKAAGGQEKLPRPVGRPWVVNGIYPGWQSGASPVFTDPREPAPDPREIGRGGLPEALGKFNAIRLTQSGVRLEYEVGGVTVREWVESEMVAGNRQVRRRFQVGGTKIPLWLVVGSLASPGDEKLQTRLFAAGLDQNRIELQAESTAPDGPLKVRIAPSTGPIEFSLVMAMTKPVADQPTTSAKTDAPPPLRWRPPLTTQGQLSSATNAYVVDDLPLPLDNPWRRNLRLADIAFFRDGRAAAITFDGDVWTITGLTGDLREVHWQRFASGLHEPLSLCVRNEELFVFDRNGIWRLRDTDGNGEADAHELFSNVFAQTAETREFASSMRPAPDGSFVLAKGGQQGSTLGRHNGSILRVSPDGRVATVLGYGLRQPFLGVNPQTGLVTASDQQGHYVPATPLHVIRDGQYYGFLSELLPKEEYPAPIAEPLTWIPHPVNASGAAQVWLHGARMGALNGALIQVGYNRPELFLVRLNSCAATPQAAVVSLTTDFAFAPLNGAVNPADGQLYVTGFQIWGTTAKRISGLARVRLTGAPNSLPREVAAMDQGILLHFDVPLDERLATNPANFSVERWNYRRTANYGSPHFKLDGNPGQEWLTPSSAYLARDGRSVFIGIPDLKPVMQMRVGWALATPTGTKFENNAYFTARELTKFDPLAEGFAPLTVDLTPRLSRAAATPVTVEEGRKLAALAGCAACHATDTTSEGKVGPTWKGLFGSQRDFKNGEPAVADDAYLRESILEPTAKVVLGFEKNEAGMPSYAGVLTEAQIQALILYLKTLK